MKNNSRCMLTSRELLLENALKKEEKDQDSSHLKQRQSGTHGPLLTAAPRKTHKKNTANSSLKWLLNGKSFQNSLNKSPFLTLYFPNTFHSMYLKNMEEIIPWISHSVYQVTFKSDLRVPNPSNQNIIRQHGTKQA
jgi:hypothetical protein